MHPPNTGHQCASRNRACAKRVVCTLICPHLLCTFIFPTTSTARYSPNTGHQCASCDRACAKRVVSALFCRGLSAMRWAYDGCSPRLTRACVHGHNAMDV
eukprot:1157266-Pelagomonas_calceolata.AAC.15